MKVVTLSITFLTQLALNSALIFPGPCPDIQSLEIFDCSTYMNSSSFRAAAYLPVDGKTLNIFHNPFESINCLDFGLACSYGSSRSMQIRYNCYPTMTGNKTTGLVTQCLPITFDSRDFDRDYNQLSNFGLGLQLMCRDKLADFKINVIFGPEKKELLGIFGCRDLTDGTHEEGAWVLAITSKDLPSDPQVNLEQFLESVSNMSATPSDFVMNDFSAEHTCTCAKCGYTLECPVDVKEEEEAETYYYYEGVNYDDYPQYDDYYTTTYDNYPDYNTDAPVYYYYDDTSYYDNSYNDIYNDIYNEIATNSTEDPILSTTEGLVKSETTIGVETTTKTSSWEAASNDVSTTEGSFHADETTADTFTTVTEFHTKFETESVTETMETFESNTNETSEDH